MIRSRRRKGPPPRVILGIGGTLAHDANAALIVDGLLVAASQEERYSRLKHDAPFPVLAIHDCLALAGLTAADVDACVFADKPLQNLVATRLDRPSNWFTWQAGRVAPERTFEVVAAARALLPRAGFHFAWHHLSHAALAFAMSPYDRAAFLCVDGLGDDVSASIGVADAGRTEFRQELPYEHGIGFLYTLVTEFLGFTAGSEYKVMGLAPYGKPAYLEQLRAFSRADGEGALRFNCSPRLPWPTVLGALASQLGLPARGRSEAIGETHANLAASIQTLFEAQLFAMAERARRITGERYLLFCGGCAQNCVAAGKLRGLGLFDGVFTSPAAGDMGTGLGAALLFRQKAGLGGDGKVDPAGFYLGSSPGMPPGEALEHEVPHDGDVFRAAARQLAHGKTLGWVRGRMELGARALGARSILADPRVDGMQAALNLKIKFRESFRPFAPAILAEDCADWFDADEPSDYMQHTALLKPVFRRSASREFSDWRERLAFRRCDFPSVVHVDYSARLQTVRRERHPELHRLLTEFRAITGFPMLINTSFNVSGQPIVRTATEAWQCFRHTALDYLVIDDRLFANPNDTTAEENRAWRAQFAELV